MSLADNPTQPILTIKFLRHGFDWKKFKIYSECEVTVVAFDDGNPKKKVQTTRFYNTANFSFEIPTPLYLQAVRTTLKSKVPDKLRG